MAPNSARKIVSNGTAAPATTPAGRDRLKKLCHDINNPLAVILGQVELIGTRHQELSSEVRRRLGEITKAAGQIKAMVRRAGAEGKEGNGTKAGQ